ncbi:MAG: apolipoprotein N-acyltransferase [Candidatus Cryptobacteroides sp.]
MKQRESERKDMPEATRRPEKTMAAMLVLFVTLASLPFLVPHTGLLSLFCLVPLLCMEYIGTENGVRRMWLWHYSAFVLWNAATTFWVCNATVGGGLFAIFANALQMSLIFGTFRWSRRVLKGILPYIFLAFLWIAWEYWYLTSAQISWPWLVLGNSFARTTTLVQWYEFTGALGGSLWIWTCNLGLFGLMMWLATGRIRTAGKVALASLPLMYILLLAVPTVYSLFRYKAKDIAPEKTLDVIVLQPNIDPYHKFEALTQSQQNAILLKEFDSALAENGYDSTGMILALAPETFTGGVVNGRIEETSITWRQFKSYLEDKPGMNLLFGASTYDYTFSEKAPSYNARKCRDGSWVESHNSAIMMDRSGETSTYHKSKLVVGVEMMPYPAFFSKIDNMLGGVIGRCVGQDEVSLLDCVSRDSLGKVTERVPVGCAICYESVYPEHCIEYVRKGAKLLTVITNDAWWGNTPGYRQHLSYSALRAIETGRYIVRSANTGISAIINPRGDILEETEWWKPAHIVSEAGLEDRKTFFVTYGDITGRVCAFMALMILMSVAVRAFVARRQAKPA